MTDLRTRIHECISLADRLPTASLPAAELDQKKIDPSEYLKAKSVYEALGEVIEYLKHFDSDEAAGVFNDQPPVLAQKVQKHLDDVHRVVEETLTAIRKNEGNEVPNRSSEGGFKKQAERIRTAFAELSTLFAPIRIEMKMTSGASLDLLAKLEQSHRETAELRRELVELTKAAKVTIGEVEDVQKRASGTKQELQASYTAKGFVLELEDAIYWHRIEGWAWLAAFLFSCLVTLRMLIWLIAADNKLGWPFCDCGPVYGAAVITGDVGLAITAAVGKLLFASFAFGLCFLTGRIYQTHAHNVIVNQQRRVAGISFPELLSMINSDDNVSRQELVRQAAISIFAHGSSGFLHKGTNEFSALSSLAGDLVRKTKDNSPSS